MSVQKLSTALLFSLALATTAISMEIDPENDRVTAECQLKYEKTSGWASKTTEAREVYRKVLFEEVPSFGETATKKIEMVVNKKLKYVVKIELPNESDSYDINEMNFTLQRVKMYPKSSDSDDDFGVTVGGKAGEKVKEEDEGTISFKSPEAAEMEVKNATARCGFRVLIGQ